LIKSYFRSFRAEEEGGAIERMVVDYGGNGLEGEKGLKEAMERRRREEYNECFELLRVVIVEDKPFYYPEMRAVALNQYGSYLYLLGE